jgi:hypothetical protein
MMRVRPRHREPRATRSRARNTRIAGAQYEIAGAQDEPSVVIGARERRRDEPYAFFFRANDKWVDARDALRVVCLPFSESMRLASSCAAKVISLGAAKFRRGKELKASLPVLLLHSYMSLLEG